MSELIISVVESDFTRLFCYKNDSIVEADLLMSENNLAVTSMRFTLGFQQFLI